ncbi:hypothetical protein N7491_009831 [Penicillium cf. griseofulvum]|uniref:Uncharacterized protein n=1 Tax=Penicillium cf. griseofulvum TaxID=2972120 RepID=A0A9W9T598_9EURO|nr:hypothetical protein N7472_000157 [Penicillium cf. griseofulvum]KAJ5421386.1 hypothetical protein N7491_009831 [Penicillium cf. griseofulvum]
MTYLVTIITNTPDAPWDYSDEESPVLDAIRRTLGNIGSTLDRATHVGGPRIFPPRYYAHVDTTGTTADIFQEALQRTWSHTKTFRDEPVPEAEQILVEDLSS